MSWSMQKQRTATPGPQGEARTHTHTQLGMLETHSQSFFAKQQGSVSAAHHPWSTPEMLDELEIPSNSFSLSNIEMDGQHVNVMAASAKFLEYATHEARYFTHCLRNDEDSLHRLIGYPLRMISPLKAPWCFHTPHRPRNWEALHPIGEIHQKLLHE